MSTEPDPEDEVDAPEDAVDAPKGRYRHLPGRVAPDEMSQGQDAEPPPDPDMGRNPDLDFMLRYGG